MGVRYALCAIMETSTISTSIRILMMAESEENVTVIYEPIVHSLSLRTYSVCVWCD